MYWRDKHIHTTPPSFSTFHLSFLSTPPFLSHFVLISVLCFCLTVYQSHSSLPPYPHPIHSAQRGRGTITVTTIIPYGFMIAFRLRIYNGIFPCFLHGRSTVFLLGCVRKSFKSSHILLLVFGGSKMSSMNPLCAATNGLANLKAGQNGIY